MTDDRDTVTDEEDPRASLLSKESRAIADDALASLDERDREAITIYYMGDGQHADVARALGISEANARQRVHRARTKLRDAVASVETTLRAARPGPAFTAACVAAIAAGKVVAADAATFANGGAKSRFAVPGGGSIVAGAAALVVVAGAIVAGAVATSRSPSGPHSSSGSSEATTSGTPRSPSGASVAVDRAAIVKPMSPAARADLVARLRVAGAAIATPPPAVIAADPAMKVYDFSESPLDGGPRLEAPPPNASSKRHLRYAIQEIQPFLAECHAGLASQGTVAMRMILSGAPDVGTLVESVEIDAGSGSDAVVFEPSFTECMRETLYAIELPPTSNVERLDVRYPFVVTPSTSAAP